MEDSKLSFDRTRHAIYTKTAKSIIQGLLARSYAPAQADALWEQIQLQYAAYLKDEPALGGLRLSAGVYDCILVFAYYVTVPDKPALEELQPAVFEIFMSSFSRLGKLFDLNRPLDFWLAARVFGAAMRMREKEIVRFPASFRPADFSFDRQAGIIRYRYTQCPTAEFAKRHGLMHVLPVLCNCDYIAMQKLHAGLIRRSTCGIGSECDYCILGDRHPLLDRYTLVTDPNGLWISRPASAGEKEDAL